jgi:hypothetical protein
LGVVPEQPLSSRQTTHFACAVSQTGVGVALHWPLLVDEH